MTAEPGSAAGGDAAAQPPEGAATMDFQSEVTQLLDLMIHSLYSNREIFLRELISNAADAIDKLKFLALSDDSLFEGDGDLRITVDFDADRGTVRVTDNGIGMTRDEVIDNLGTIARSGTRQFFDNLTGDAQHDARLIGQFGVGFYSAFIVAEEVTVLTRRAGEPPEAGVRWTSDGKGAFTIAQADRPARGTEVELKLKEDAREFADAFRLRGVIKRYSEHIDTPIYMPAADPEAADDSEEQVNAAQALWVKSKNELDDDAYQGFYKQLTHDFDDALTWVHSKVEGKLEYVSLFYIPRTAPFDLWDRDAHKGVKLYVQRVFIMEDDGQLLPRYLRFVRGVIDTNDLPLNVSREILQRNKVVDSIRAASVKKILGTIESLAEDPEKFAVFWPAFGRVLKEGIIEDPSNQERIAKLLRFNSTHEGNASEAQEQKVSLEDYRSRMGGDQKKIYYLVGEDLATARQSPLLEVFRDNDIEVLLLTDPVDEWWVAHLNEFDGCALQSVAKGELDFEPSAGKDATPAQVSDDFVGRIKDVLVDEVKEVRASSRLTDSPSCLVTDEMDMTPHLERILRAAGQEVPASKPILEINPAHPVVKQLAAEKDEERFAGWVRMLYDQAVLADGGRLADPGAFVKRVNDLMLKVALMS